MVRKMLLLKYHSENNSSCSWQRTPLNASASFGDKDMKKTAPTHTHKRKAGVECRFFIWFVCCSASLQRQCKEKENVLRWLAWVATLVCMKYSSCSHHVFGDHGVSYFSIWNRDWLFASLLSGCGLFWAFVTLLLFKIRYNNIELVSANTPKLHIACLL